MLKKILHILTLRAVFLRPRFFALFAGITVLFILSFNFSFLFPVAKAVLVAAAALVVVDLILLFNKGLQIEAQRELPRQLSLGDDNEVRLKIHNDYGLKLGITIVDEVPVEFQRRDFGIVDTLPPNVEKAYQYNLRPTLRGEYTFNDINVFVHSPLGLVERRIQKKAEQKILVYPSIQQMNRFSLMAIARISTMRGVKKVRRLGASYEFAQIRNYVKGDDYRSINWKATSRRNELMINQFEDERSQQIFSVIDKGRSMQMPFHGMSLLDYAVNTALVISSISLQKHDRAGLDLLGQDRRYRKGRRRPQTAQPHHRDAVQRTTAQLRGQLRAALHGHQAVYQAPQPAVSLHQFRELLRDGTGAAALAPHQPHALIGRRFL